jgi:enoyl-CoA hydratase
VNHVVPQENLIGKCEEILNKILDMAPLAIGEIVNTVNACYNKESNGFTTEIERFGACFITNDFKEGTEAFLGKRKANFTGQ